MILVTIDVASVKQIIECVLTDNQVALKTAFNLSLTSISDELLQSHIITQDVHTSPSYDNIIGSFKATMNFISTLPELEAYCSKFLTALSNVGGQLRYASKEIQQKWIETVRNEVGTELHLVLPQ